MRAWPLVLLLAACAQQQEAAQEAVSEAAVVQQEAVAEVVTPAVFAVQDAAAVVVEALPVPPPAPRESVHPDALALIVAFEVVSPAYYSARLQGIICPGGASGPTGGIGYDFGHQSAAIIRRDWGHRPDVERLATAGGVTGPGSCRAWRAQHLDIRISLAEAERVFDQTMMPTWLRATRRAYPGIDLVSPQFEGGIVSNTFNRGTSFLGDRAAEKRAVRDDCVPAKNAPCAAAQVRKSCRLWAGTKLEAGLCRRRNAEGDLIETTT